MSARARGLAVVALLLLAGCGGSADQSEAPPEDPAAGDTGTEGTDEEAAAGGAGAGPTTLFGSVGTEEDPEAFVIALTDESGEPVTELPAGDYVIEVSDPATTHNFHLVGGSVDETTSVPGTEETTFEVTLEPGEYTYRCDPHPPMTETFTVS